MKPTDELYSVTYLSGACNSHPHATDWTSHGICVAVDDAIAILNPELSNGHPGKFSKSLFAHKGRVNTVKWLRTLSGTALDSFVSVSIDGTAILWIRQEDYVPAFVMKGHGESITDVYAVSMSSDDSTDCILIATISLEKLVLWRKMKHEDNFSIIDTFIGEDAGIGVSGLSLIPLPDSPFVVFASPKNFINVCLYTAPLSLESTDGHVFHQKQVLTGHSNWINDLAFACTDGGESILLASASHDCTIRVWRITSQDPETKSTIGEQEFIFTLEERHYSVTVYSILHGHDHWVYTLQWNYFENENEDEKLKLLSVSADKTLIIWKKDVIIDTWVENYRLGDIGGNFSAFVGGSFDPTGQFVMAHDLQGAFHVWKHDKKNDSWIANVLPSGHYDEVTDIQWDPDGLFLMSVSADKTTRLHAPSVDHNSYWYEFARPQTHGYIISCLTVLPQFRFVSGAAEKELRSFVASKTFVKKFQPCTSIIIDESKYSHNSAILPTLDLSNKPADEVDVRNIDGDRSTDVNSSLPTEEELSQKTLWPEIQKLYYHPNEVSCVTSTVKGELIASACKANSAKEAIIVIWMVNEWDDIQRWQELEFHQLTVTQMAFAPCGRYLLAVSRDRSWSLFCRDDSNKFKLIASNGKNNGVHKRQLNCCSWSHDSKFFATGSRDGKLVIWSKDDVPPDSSDSLNGYCNRYVVTAANDNVCSVSFAPVFVKSNAYLFAVGYGSGKIELYVWNENSFSCRLWTTIGENMAHGKAISRVVFRPTLPSNETEAKLQLASCGCDKLMKIYTLNLSTL